MSMCPLATLGVMRLMRRRCVLSLPIIAATGVSMAGCSWGKDGQSPTSGASSAASPATTAGVSPPSASPGEGVRLEGTLGNGAAAAVEVGPAVRSGVHTVVRLRFTTEEDDSYSVQLDGQYSLLDVCLLSLERGVTWPELDTSWVLAGPSVSREEPLDVFPVYID